MEQVWQGLVAPSFHSLGVPYLMGMHDARFHLGEGSAALSLTRHMELANSDGVLTFSRHERKKFLDRYSYESSRVWSVEHGWPTDIGVEPRKRELPPRDLPIVVGFFGRILPYKGVDLAAEAVEALLPRFPRLQLRIFGSGTTEALERWRAVPWLQVQNSWVAESKMGSVIDSFDVLILPYREASQSGVLGLAATIGIPTVATPVGAFREQVGAEGIGLVADAISAEAVASAIEALLTQPSLYEACSERAIARRQAASWAAASEGMASVIDELCGLGPRAGSIKLRAFKQTMRSRR